MYVRVIAIQSSDIFQTQCRRQSESSHLHEACKKPELTTGSLHFAWESHKTWKFQHLGLRGHL